ncbi:hypothetical protein FVEG_12825 [Fusarium verticillioides 7600]|uniref:Uncharacterized protein n=1 Tax=Gibberella moniliformis (strain M3125 / FGSC 7600) TaxID=334819 RepID=W7MT83_GIBM7|nr:hypothetical protein FVEG_12825 [Fusarium verticillioides 7600]EWG54673.1 hypothetical protein FVEG_12825 [Fusarium verticillioides 7600]RBQ64918.1 hypothetical protein FVER14953_12825 [Fusarium verticillioides]RBQ83993.1 hypothetical protein FVER53263_12825 [Fusarium verticillioides]RBR21709.1 hypothetical protein FVER53590_12825 [Fusarium verticillioides]
MPQDAVEHYYAAHKLVERVEDWAKEVSIATEDTELAAPINPEAKVPRIIRSLLEQHEEARLIMDLIEEQLLKLNYELPQKGFTAPTSSKYGGSSHRGGSHREYLAEDSDAQVCPPGEIWPYIPLGSDSGDSSKKKKKKSKRPKTEEEKNRHINKVFIRENGILPLLDPSAQL